MKFTVIGIELTGEARAAAYRTGLCVDCSASPQSPGRPRCEPCHHAWVRRIPSGSADIADIYAMKLCGCNAKQVYARDSAIGATTGHAAGAATAPRQTKTGCRTARSEPANPPFTGPGIRRLVAIATWRKSVGFCALQAATGPRSNRAPFFHMFCISSA
jgi:hypothetical protein